MSDTSELEGPKIDRRTSIKLLSAAGFSGVSASLAGCAGDGGSGGENTEGGDQGETASPTPPESKGGEITAAWLVNEIPRLDPHMVNKGVQMQVMTNLFNGLVKVNTDLEIVGDVASDWTVSDDGQTYEFTIREGITFHNGDTLDAEMCKRSIDRVREMDKSPHSGKVAMIEATEAPDATTLVIELARPTAPFLAFMSLVPGRAGCIVNVNAVEEMGDEEYNRMPVGSGPFELTDRDTGTSLTLEKFDNYWETDEEGNQLPYLDKVTIELIPEPSTLWSAVQTGSAQFASSLPGQFAEQARGASNIQLRQSSPGDWKGVSLLANNPAEDPYTKYARWASGNDEIPGADKWEGKDIPTADPKVRRAIAKAIDREALVEKGYFGLAVPAHQLFNPLMFVYEEEPDPGQYYDPEGAKELLDEAGYTGDTRFEMRILGTPEDERGLTVIQSQLSEVGIEAELDIQQSSSYWTTIYEYTHMSQMYGGSAALDPYADWYKQLHTPVPPEEGVAGTWQKNLYSNEELDEIMEEDFRTADRDKREELIKEGMEIFVEESPFAMTVFPQRAKPQGGGLKNVGIQVGMSNFHRAYLED